MFPINRGPQIACLEPLERMVPASHTETLHLEDAVFPSNTLQINLRSERASKCSGQLALDPVVGDVLTHQKGRAGGDKERRDDQQGRQDSNRDKPTFHRINRTRSSVAGQSPCRFLLCKVHRRRFH